MDLPSDSMDNRYPIDVRLESRMVDAMRLFVSLRSHGMLGWHAETYSSDPLSAGSFRKNGRHMARPSRTGGIGPNSRTSSGRMKPVRGSLRKKTGECGKRGGTAVSDVRNRTKIIVLVK